jgi:hypothetical protein
MPSTLLEIISPSHRRPLAMADSSFLLALARIGLAPPADPLDGWMTSRLRRKACGDQGIAINLEGRSESSRSRISIDPDQRQGTDGVEDDSLDSFRRDPRGRSGFILLTLEEVS